MSCQILVVKPNTVTELEKALLSEAGVVCIESEEPEAVRLLSPEAPAISGNDLLLCALQALSHNGDVYNRGVEQRALFTKLTAEMFASMRKAA